MKRLLFLFGLCVAAIGFAAIQTGCSCCPCKGSGAVIPWVNVPPLADTGVACPMGIDFGPDGDLYVCDNQGWKGTPKGQFRGRILRLIIRDNQAVATGVAEGMEHPNGVRVHNGFLYVTQSLMSKVKYPSVLTLP